jgi:hypothetical protein
MSYYSITQTYSIIQLLVGELLFLYPYKKRKHFWILYPILFAFCIIVCYFCPKFGPPAEKIKGIVKFVFSFSLSVAVYFICFDLKFKVTLSLCSAGYALQHIVFQISTIFQSIPFGEGFSTFVTEYHRTIEMVIFAILYLIFFFTFGKHIAKLRVDKNFNNVLNFLAFFVIVVCVVLSIFTKASNRPISVAIYSIICCVLALTLQFTILNITQLHQENEKIKAKMDSDIDRYEAIKDVVDFVNCKCHDLKKELNSIKDVSKIEDLEEVKNTIEIYDSIPHTGNVIIDTIIIHSVLGQSNNGVTFTFSGNGEWLNFVSDVDLKSLFMNIISNAVEAVANVDQDKRNISIVIEKKGSMVLITVRNYYVGLPVDGDKLPKSSKKDCDEHGFGLKSMSMVAKKYHGAVNVSGTGEIFTLNVYLLNDNQ